MDAASEQSVGELQKKKQDGIALRRIGRRRRRVHWMKQGKDMEMMAMFWTTLTEVKCRDALFLLEELVSLFSYSTCLLVCSHALWCFVGIVTMDPKFKTKCSQNDCKQMQIRYIFAVMLFTLSFKVHPWPWNQQLTKHSSNTVIQELPPHTQEEKHYNHKPTCENIHVLFLKTEHFAFHQSSC